MNEIIRFETTRGGRIWKYAILLKRTLTVDEIKKLDEAKSQREFLKYLSSLNIVKEVYCYATAV